LEKLLSFIPEKEGTILDVGCGKGASTRYLLKYYKPDHVTGVDVSEKSLATCRKNAPGVALRVMDAVNLEFPDGSFDNILCMSSASYFNTRAKFLCEAHRVLKPRGCLVLSENIQRVMAQDPQERSVQTANYVRNSEEYREICLRAGFEEVMAKDITRESWGEFSQHLAAYLEKARQRGTINFRRYTMIRAWLNQAVLQTEFCVLAVCRKS
jgi:ubiquinone/menaquinone biosynthesis C-methylase UbiE